MRAAFARPVVCTLAELLLSQSVFSSSLVAAINIRCGSGCLDLTTGPDPLGLDKATLTLNAGFDTIDTYVDLFGFPAIVADSDSLVISGASVAGTNGTYSETAGLAFFPTFDGQWFDSAGVLADYAVNGEQFTLPVLNGCRRRRQFWRSKSTCRTSGPLNFPIHS